MIDRVSHDDDRMAPDGHEDPRPDAVEDTARDDATPSPHSPAPDVGDRPKHDVIDLANGGAATPRDGDDTAPSRQESAPEQDTAADDNPSKAPPKSLFIGVALLVLVLVGWGGYQHWRSYAASKATVDNEAGRPVEVRTVAAKRLDSAIDMTLPGETQALDTANIFPRATGYIDRRLTDIGSRVRKGDLMAHIAAPDLDQQLAQAEAQIGQTEAALVQAKAQVVQAEANVNLAQVNLARTSTLTQQGYETQQNRDTQQANAKTQQANVESARAGVAVAGANIKAQQAAIDRLKALTAFEDVRAPFDGVVTARNVDVGELVSADQSTGSPMFTAVRDSTIRVIVRVPQNVSAGVRTGLAAKVAVPQQPEQVFAGTVTRTSSAVLYSSRTLTTEIDIPNPSGALRAGLYVSVSFAIPRTTAEVNIPAEALMFDQTGTRVAAVQDGKIHMAAVNIARDNGTTLDLRDGVKGDERIVLNPPATLKDGATVTEARSEDEKQDGQGADKAAAPKQSPTTAENGGS
ncbi:efflux RND transporter periplasmic adaptor subunit [Lichenihabitans sp. Uapishka_5]|uniref:efflux RND transporter periplasmic adaptor subunit n=1 Tax=Lichenihabitans sp. Uapishka_5 TaxID=3037302 RepID=UPI0029E7D69D|nr:efflux RND transporter periplasmic adaptor subunit [Lichenihabitans sp. Uapishka_5]MDX7952408.1 efflux RND transporter periplasmic adaptor subunit [Lichenihabitans sp. Uapishka_5]